MSPAVRYSKVGMGKETWVALFQRKQLPQMDKSDEDTNFGLKMEEGSLVIDKS